MSKIFNHKTQLSNEQAAELRRIHQAPGVGAAYGLIAKPEYKTPGRDHADEPKNPAPR